MDELRDNRNKMQPDSDFEERPMKDINRAGATEKREGELRELMRKLKQSGKVGKTGMMSDMNEGGALEAARRSNKFALPPPAAVTPPPSPPPPVEPSGPRADWLDAKAEDEAEGDAVVKWEGAAAAPAAAPPSAEKGVLDDGSPKTSGSVGGRWVPPAEPVESMKPKVSTWGVFERPADISKAYGGGKKIGIGGTQEDPEERARKQKEIEEKLKSYRKSLGGDYEAEQEHRAEIEAARVEARQLMRMGDVKAALATLVRVEPWLCDGTELGGRTLLELGWAYDAAGDRDTGRTTMARLRNSPVKEVRRQSQQLAFQDEAASFLGVSESMEDVTTEYTKLSRLPRVRTDRRYNLLDGALSSGKRPVGSLSEARMVLRTAAVRRSDGGQPKRLLSAVKYVRDTAEGELDAEQKAAAASAEPPVPEGGAEACGELLRGTWLLGTVVRTGQAKASFAPQDAQQELKLEATSGTFERLAPGGGPGLYRTKGSAEVKMAGGRVKQPVIKLEAEECRLGPLPLPVPSMGRERLLLLDRTICVLESGAGEVSVWVRPTLKADPEGL